MPNVNTKTIVDSYIYSIFPEYNKAIISFIMKAERIDKNSKEFQDVVYDVRRRRISEILSKVITSQNVVIGLSENMSLPKAFRVFVAKDLKDSSKLKTFIDGTDCIKVNNGMYDCTDINWLISYLVNGVVSFIYKVRPEKLMLDQSVVLDGCECFVKLFSYVIDRIYKIVSIQSLKKRVDYFLAMYFLVNIMQKDFTSDSGNRNIRNIATKVANIEDRDAAVVDMAVDPHDFDNIKTAVEAMGRIFKFKDIKVDIIIAMWMQSFGTGTQFALEFFPQFSAMLTNAYIGGYLNNQNTIEKLCSGTMSIYCKNILKIGETVS